MRTPLIAANWKMNLDRAAAEDYCRRVRDGQLPEDVEVVIFPPFTLLPAVAGGGLDATAVAWGGQDLHPEAAGAHTGDTSAAHLRDWDAKWALCGHSERRTDHGENDELVGRKVAAAIRGGLMPMLCVGETEAERDSGETEEVLTRQLRAGLPDLSGEAPVAWALAYEPVWAIGTGKTASSSQAQEAHAHLRRQVAKIAGGKVASALRILYGGSVKPDNCEELIGEPDIDGFLVGGASLDPGSFLDIIRRCGSR